MDKEKVPPIIGAALLVAGIIVVFFVFIQAFGMATNVGDYFREQFPEEEGGEDVEGPTAAFSWTVDGRDVDFRDESEPGDSDMIFWEWDFGDGDTSNQQEPYHTYDFDGDFRVSLRVEDQNGESHSTYGDVYVESGNFHDGGRSEEDFRDMNFEFSAGGILFPIAAAILVGMLFMVMFLVGAAMIKAGWNLIKPGPSTLKLKIKPKKLEVEQNQPEPAYSPQLASSPKPEYPQPEQAYQSRPTPDAIIASMMALPEAHNPQHPQYAQADSGYYGQQTYASGGPPRPIPQSPTPPGPSFDTPPPPPPPMENTPHPNQTVLGSYPSESKEETKQPTPPTRDSKPQTPDPKTEGKQPPVKSNQTLQVNMKDSQKPQRTQQPTKASGSAQRRNGPQRTRQQQGVSPQKTQDKRRQKSRSKKGKGRKKR